MPIFILSRRQISGESGTILTQAQAQRRSVTGSLTTYAQASGPTSGQLVTVAQARRVGVAGRLRSAALGLRPGSALAAMPVAVSVGAAPQRWEVSTSLGCATKASYTHSGEDETATLTLNVRREALPEQLALTALLGDLPGVGTTLTVDPRQWEETTQDGVTSTTIRLYNRAAYLARSTPLPELVNWVLYPRRQSAGPGPAPRIASVSGLIRQAAHAAGLRFALIGPDPFAGETWQEGRRDTSTEGRTFADLFGEAYGALGYRLIVRGDLLLGVPPGGHITEALPSWTVCEVESLTRRGESGGVPGRIQVSAADAQVPKLKPEAAAQPEGDKQSDRDKQQSWLTYSREGDTLTVSTGYVQGGVVRETQEITLGRVEVRETVDDKEQKRVFDRVLISDTYTTFSYHPSCPEALVSQSTTKHSYGYTLATKTQMRGVSGRMFNGNFAAGDLVGNETEIVAQRWYEGGADAGYLAQRLAQSKRLVSVQQANPDGELDKRGLLEGREYVAQVLTDQYRRVGEAWSHQWGTSGGATVPLYDAETQDAVRLTIKTGTMQSGSEIMRNDPPKVNWPKVEGQPDVPQDVPDLISWPQHAQFVVTGGGPNTLQQSFPMLATASKLHLFAEYLAQANGPVLVRELSLKTPRAALPGDGDVTEFSLSLDGMKRMASLTLETRTEPGLSGVPWPPDRSATLIGVVQARPAASTATVAVLTGVNAAATEGIWQDVAALIPTGTTVSVGASVGLYLGAGGQYVIGGG